MEATVDTTTRADEHLPRIRVPRPMPGGTYVEEDLGAWVDRLVGGRRYERQAAAELEPLFSTVESTVPEPVEVPSPVPGGTEPITKGGDPPAETR